MAGLFVACLVGAGLGALGAVLLELFALTTALFGLHLLIQFTQEVRVVVGSCRGGSVARQMQIYAFFRRPKPATELPAAFLSGAYPGGNDPGQGAKHDGGEH